MDVYLLASSLTRAIDNYAGILQQAGYNYALADYKHGTGRPEPSQPPTLPTAWNSCPLPPASAGGPGSGLVDDGLNIAAAVGIPIPDGDPDKLIAAADAWEKLAKSGGAGGLAEKLEGVARSFDAVTAPESSYIDEDIRDLKVAAEDIVAMFYDLAQSCRDQKAAIDELRTQLKSLLEDLAKDIAVEVATTVVFSVVAGALSAGFGAAAVAAARSGRIAAKIAGYARKIADIVRAAKLATAVKLKSSAKTLLDKLQRILGMIKTKFDNIAAKVVTPRFRATQMDPRYVGENIPGNSIWPGSAVKYLSAEERKAYELTVRDGKIYDANGNLFDTTAASTAHSGDGKAIFVMDENGKLYASTYHAPGQFHHSSFLAGQPVSGAGAGCEWRTAGYH
ncbi:hypothetical protein [Nocardia arizonensis]|uniref:hypothetical protein n=1 Tax=Nocardia arizonensis TaxID=1141647 RepID=UPI000A70BCCD|nr:hypothetical protein [Nocardia arizonensis]